MSKVLSGIVAFVVDYCQRHAHPLNAVLHVFGVPMVFYGIYLWCVGNAPVGWALFIGGYLLQYLGHKAQGNEVGEVTLIKKIYRKLSGSRTSGEDSIA